MRFTSPGYQSNVTMLNAGWHCSWCFFGNAQAVVQKLQFWSEQKVSKTAGINITDFTLFVTECRTSLLRGGKRCVYFPFPKAVPRYVQNNPDFFGRYFSPMEPGNLTSMTVLDVPDLLLSGEHPDD